MKLDYPTAITRTYTRDVNLAAAVWTCGARFCDDTGLLVKLIREKTDDKARKQPYFWFELRQSVAHPYPAPALIPLATLWKNWQSADYAAKHPSDPFMVMKRAFDAYRTLARKAEARQILPKNPDHHARLLETRNTKLAATLLAFGAREPLGVAREAGAVAWLFEDEQLADLWPDERHITTTGELGARFQTNWFRSFPDSALAYCRFGLENRERLLRIVSGQTPMVYKRVGDRRWLIKPKIDPETGNYKIVLPNI